MREQVEASLSTHLRDDLLRLAQQAKDALAGANSRESIESVRVSFLGKKGHLSVILRQMGSLPAEERPVIGQIANRAKEDIEQQIDVSLQHLAFADRAKELKSSIDVTLPGRSKERGSLHPLTQATDLILEVLNGLGFEHVGGPEIEHDFYNFEALNIPRDHPAREMQDTFYVAPDVVLRTHTSPVQIRAMLAVGTPPLRVVSTGRVYRRDQDATHSPMFHQVEGLFIDKQVTFADLKGTLEAFVEKVFEKGTKIRLRPSYFPFTEPSAEVDMSCFACQGKGCRLCKGTGWIEILGSGMVDPAVLKAVGFDADKYSGFAFGMGVERIAMLRYGISDIRLFYENDVRFLQQF